MQGDRPWPASSTTKSSRRSTRFCSPYGGVRAGIALAAPGAIAATTLLGGLNDCLLRVDETRWFNPGATVRIDDGQTVGIRHRALGRGRGACA